MFTNLYGEKILITGAHGFLGRYLSKKYSLLGAKIYGIGHGEYSLKEISDNGLTYYLCDEINVTTLLEACANPNKIIHCGSSASVPYSVLYPKEDFERTVNSTLSVLEFMRQHTVNSKLVIPSSAAVYGQKNKKQISVNDKTNPVSPYGNSKKISETISKFYSSFYKLNISIVRFFSLYGPGLKKQLLWDAWQKASSGNHCFSGTGLETRDLLHIDDAAELILYALEKASNKAPIVNGGTGRAASIKEVLFKIYEELEITQIPEFSGKVREGDPLFFEANLEEALLWGWKPTISWEEGISQYAKWYKNINNL